MENAQLSDGSSLVFFHAPNASAPLPAGINDFDVPPDPSGDVYAQLFDAGGTAVGSPYVVNTTTFHTQYHPVVLQFGNGDFVVAWSQSQGGSSFAVGYQRYDAAGSRLGGEVLIPTSDDPIDTMALTPTGRDGFDIFVGRTSESFAVSESSAPPSAEDDYFSVDEEQTLTGNVLADNGNGPDIDPDGGALTVTLISGPEAGTLTLNEDGSFSYLADADAFDLATPGEVLQDKIVYRVSNGSGKFDEATATILVNIVDEGVTLIGGQVGLSLTGTDGGEDTIIGGRGNDELFGLDGSDVLRGEKGNDYIYGGEGIDFIDGGDGADFLSGGQGNDTLNGGTGGDRLSGGLGADIIDGGDDIDTVDYRSAAGAVNVSLNSGTSYGAEGNDQIINVENIDGSDYGDRLVGNAGDNVLNGGSGNDIIRALAGADTVEGGAGSDRLFGNDGNDHLDGGEDDDILEGGFGNDTLIGGSGADILRGEGDDDTLSGGLGDDTLRAGTGNDTVDGGEGADRLFGAGGNDVLHGGNGIDRLEGQRGDDTLVGGGGNDFLFGGAGIDTFVFNSTDAGGLDRIRDWQSVDLLDVSSYGFSSFEEFLATGNDSVNGARFVLGQDSEGLSQVVLIEGITLADLTAQDVLLTI